MEGVTEHIQFCRLISMPEPDSFPQAYLVEMSGYFAAAIRVHNKADVEDVHEAAKLSTFGEFRDALGENCFLITASRSDALPPDLRQRALS